MDHEFECQRVFADIQFLVKVVAITFTDVASHLEGGQHVPLSRTGDAVTHVHEQGFVGADMDCLLAVDDMDLVVKGRMFKKTHGGSPRKCAEMHVVL